MDILDIAKENLSLDKIDLPAMGKQALTSAFKGQGSESVKFGQAVRAEVVSEDGKVVLDSSGLRVDFKILSVGSFDRAEVKIYNLNNDTIGSITARDNYLNLYVQLHEFDEEQLLDTMFISNSYNQVDVPEGITFLYCFSKLRKDLLEKVVPKAELNSPSLSQVLNKLQEGVNITFEYKNFPDEVKKYKAKTGYTEVLDGTVESNLNRLAISYHFTYYMKGPTTVLILYTPEVFNIQQSGVLDKEPDIILDTNDMRSTPSVGVASITIDSVLNASIETGSVIDASKLVTASTKLGLETLAVTKEILSSSVSKYSRYVVIGIEHSGSNYTNVWNTKASGVASTSGLTMPTNEFNWKGK